MKLHTPPPPTPVIRIDLKGGKANSRVITLDSEGVTIEQALDWVHSIMQTITITINPTDKHSNIIATCYEAKGDSKGKSKSMTLYGVTSEYVYNELMKNL